MAGFNQYLFKDLTGKRFGKWVAQWPIGKKGKNRCTYWLALCDCGTISHMRTGHLAAALKAKSGCSGCAHTKHGLAYTIEYKMWGAAKWRSKQEKVPFNIEPQDIVIPKRCPLLNIKLKRGKGVGGMLPESPSLDKKIPSLGYVKGNIQVISQKANVIKNNATLKEIQLIVKNWSLMK